MLETGEKTTLRRRENAKGGAGSLVSGALRRPNSSGLDALAVPVQAKESRQIGNREPADFCERV